MKKFFTFFIDHPRFTSLMFVGIFLFGIFSIKNLPKEANPEVNIPIAVVVTPYLGASAKDVEAFVTTPLEEAMAGLEGLDSYTSESSAGLSVITLNFFADEDVQEKINDVNTILDRVKSDLPSEVSDSQVTRVSFSDLPILTIALSSSGELEALSEEADFIADRWAGISGVSKVQKIGAIEKEWRANLRLEALDQAGLSPFEVLQALQSVNSDLPVGSLEASEENFSLRSSAGLRDVEELALFELRSSTGQTFLLKDFVDIELVAKDQNSKTWILQEDGTFQEAMAFRIFKSPGADLLTTVDALQADRAELEKQYPQWSFLTTSDNSVYVRADLANLSSSGLQTILIVFVILGLFLTWKEAALAAVSIPFTFFITFIALFAIGDTLNSLVLFALILSTGILVDTSIVVIESISEFRKQGLLGREAAIQTLEEFQYPIIAGVLTTIFAFLPMLLVSGIMGEFIRSIPITVSFVLLGSLFVALIGLTTFVPIFLKNPKEEKASDKASLFSEVLGLYREFLQWMLAKKRRAILFVLTLVFAFFASLALPATGLLKVNMFPPSDEDQIFLDLELPIGTASAQTEALLQESALWAQAQEEVESVVVSSGVASASGSILEGGSSDASYFGSLTIDLKEERERSSQEIIQDWNKKIPQAPRARLRFAQASSGPGDAFPVEIRLLSEDKALLQKTADEIEAFVAKIPGTEDVQQDQRAGNGELYWDIDREFLSDIAMPVSTLQNYLFFLFNGLDIQTLRQESDSYDFRLDVPEMPLPMIQALPLPWMGQRYDLGQLAELSYLPSPEKIRHYQGDSIIRVQSKLAEGVSAAQVFAEVSAWEQKNTLPEGVRLEMGGEQEDIAQSFQDLFKAFILAVLMIAGLLVLQFNSFKQPFYIVLTIPLALIGVFPGLFIMNEWLSFPGLIGVVALAGIVVNNAILLVDAFNIQKRKGGDHVEAVISSAVSRFQPILLTTLTTCLGIIPLAFSDPVWASLAYAIAFGLMFSMVLSLVLLPILLNFFEKRV